MKKKLVSYALCLIMMISVGIQPIFAQSTVHGDTQYEILLNKCINNIEFIDGNVYIFNQDSLKLSQNEKKLLPTLKNDLSKLYEMGNIHVDGNNRVRFRSIEELKVFKAVDSKNMKESNDSFLKYPEYILRSLPDEPSYFNLQSKVNSNTRYLKKYYNDLMELFIKYPNAPIMPQFQTQIEFASKVAEGQPWDYKREIGWDQLRTVRINGNKHYLRGEDIGNIHYAYVGRSIGFSKKTLCLAGGIVQILTSKGGSLSQYSFDSYYDDPNDQKAIKRGANWYDSGRFN